jgi:hypothetical protein
LRELKMSLAGEWGELKRKDLGLKPKLESTTTNKAMFGDQHIKEANERSKHAQARFSKMKADGGMILKFTDTNVHFEESQVFGGEEGGSMTEGSVGSQSQTIGGEDMPRGLDQPSELSLSRTKKYLYSSDAAPIAVGRSGPRVEHGTGTSGLIGERLCLDEEPGRNSYVQRCWLGRKDPALTYKTEGIPEAYHPNYMSLHGVGEGNEVDKGWNHHRVYHGPMSKTQMYKELTIYSDER